MEDYKTTPGFDGLVSLLNAPNRRAAKKICRDLAVEHEDLFRFIIAGQHGLLEPYRYACHFAFYTPPGLELSQEDHAALTAHTSGPFTGKAKRTVNILFQILKDRRQFAAHLFYLPSYEFWTLLYFDQRDRAEEGNHWSVGGPHIHYSCEAFTTDNLHEMWGKICQLKPAPPNSEHIRFRGEENGA
ncbi:hypothetical protein [Pseudomonas sp. CGJS7]|uniref:hypothetical protein n=1 Tax=Pseudomonas sp. CGJS7 TaxID=3109348 RepID=UPI00300BC4F5